MGTPAKANVGKHVNPALKHAKLYVLIQNVPTNVMISAVHVWNRVFPTVNIANVLGSAPSHVTENLVISLVRNLFLVSIHALVFVEKSALQCVVNAIMLMKPSRECKK